MNGRGGRAEHSPRPLDALLCCGFCVKPTRGLLGGPRSPRRRVPAHFPRSWKPEREGAERHKKIQAFTVVMKRI